MTIKATCHYCGRPIFEGSPAYTDLIFSYCSPKCKADYKAQSEGGGNSGAAYKPMARKPSREERREAEAAQQKALLADIHTRYEIMKEEAQKSSEYWQREREAREASRKRELGAFVDADDKEHLLEKLDQEAKNLLKCEKFSEEDVIKANQWRDEAKAAVEEAWREEQEKNLLTDRIFSICEDLSHKGGDSACNTCKNVGRLKKKLKKR